MTGEELRNLNWKVVKGWGNIEQTGKLGLSNGLRSIAFYRHVDVMAFVIDKYQSIAREVQMPYEEVEAILVSENKAFYELLNKTTEPITKNEMLALRACFKLPDVTEAGKVNACIALLQSLSLEGKLEVLRSDPDALKEVARLEIEK